MSTTQQVKLSSEDAVNAYLAAHGTVLESIAAFDAVVTDPAWGKVVIGLSADEADLLLGEEKGRGYYIVQFAKAMSLTSDGASLWDLDGSVREAFVKNAEAVITITGDYTKLTAEGNLPKWATRETLIRKLSLVGKKEPKEIEKSILVERHVKAFLKDVRLGNLTVEQKTEVLNALEAVIASK